MKLGLESMRTHDRAPIEGCDAGSLGSHYKPNQGADVATVKANSFVQLKKPS